MDTNWLAARNNHTYENGRRYYGFRSEFPFPDDKTAVVAHGAINGIWHDLLDGKTFIAPIEPVQKTHKFLEFATRSGSWTLMVLEQHHPAPRLTGIDVTQMSANHRYFENHDIEGEWPFTAKQAFHLIHAQSLGGLIADYNGFYANAFRHLLPGGWLEVWENDLRFLTDNPQNETRLVALREWEALMHQAAASFGKRINVVAEQKELIHSAGFVQVEEQIFKVPFDDWSDDPKLKCIGRSYVFLMQHALEGYTLRLFTKTLGWSKEDTDALISRVQEELKQDDLRLYSYFHLFIGHKPSNAPRK
ncbi:S-adenosyl-L-methionine-dependent methyltransferase [Talaromyces proteolyticus]|uniref:S-adenosyl-L-methionine-dependent methyltransferase n=1 Tax=Talaromyces proteolyticus TaxID=1131652 RepID=A0AAD4Q106_9EURO|nr:S-adenosyl-L-methionine-dependent methyltransferase [Talaromyces proteolyticus]KAH8697758.1 S-adenosyl-L-methionine-dependent methyltransferase [Talaromyces proteolyticus]